MRFCVRAHIGALRSRFGTLHALQDSMTVASPQRRPRGSSGLRTAAVLIVVVAVMYLAREIFIPLAFAVTLALILSPAVYGLQKLHFSRILAVLTVMVVSLVAVAGVSYILFNELVQAVGELPAYRENINKKIKSFRSPYNGALGKVQQSVTEISKELTKPQEPAPADAPRTGRTPTPANPLPVQMVEPAANSWVYLRDLTQPFLAPLAILGIVLIFTLFLLVQESDVRNRILRLAGVHHVNVMTQALDDATRRVSRYLLLQFLVNLGFGALCAIGLYFIGVPYAVLWGAVAALLRIVPYVGSITAGLFPLILALAVFDGWRQPLLVLLLFTISELVTGNFLEPWLYGAHTGISSLALLLTAVVWAVLWGPAGLILSTPLTVCLVVLGRHVPQLSFLHILLGDEPVLAPEARLYQRLLAMDEQESRVIAEEYLKDKSLLQLYDSVILPALALAEQDRHKGAIDPEREEFMFLSLRELLAEVAEKSDKTGVESARDASDEGRILIIPAHDEADEIAAAMLAQLLEQAGRPAVSFPLGVSPQTLLEVSKPNQHDVVCISSIPPLAFAHVRSLTRRLTADFPHIRILAGVWGFNGDKTVAMQRLQPARPEMFAGTFAQALEHLGLAAPTPTPTPATEEPALQT